MQRGTTDCIPVRGSELPADAIVGIKCASTDPAVALAAFYLFPDDETMLAAYLSRMEAEGVGLDTGFCSNGESERAYFPAEGLEVERAGCFLDADGLANYQLTMPRDHVYIALHGRSADMVALETFAWEPGNPDMPGLPTLWSGGID